MSRISMREAMIVQKEECSGYSRQQLEDLLQREGYEVSYQMVGKRTTAAIVKKGDIEIVGYTYLKELDKADPELGRYNALRQAMARKRNVESL